MFKLIIYTIAASCFIFAGTYTLTISYKYIKKSVTSVAVSDFSLLGVWILWILLCIVGPFFFYYQLANTIGNNFPDSGFVHLVLNFVMLLPSIIFCIFVKNPFAED